MADAGCESPFARHIVVKQLLMVDDMVVIQKTEAQLDTPEFGTTYTRIGLCTSTEWSGVDGVLDILFQMVEEDAV